MIFLIVLTAAVFTGAQGFFGDLAKVPNLIADPIVKVIFSNKCMEDLGCFYTGPPYYHPILRPISLSPFDLEDMKTHFWLFTPDRKEEKYQLEPNADSIERSSFNSRIPTKFITHGYITDLKEGDARYRMKDAFLKEGDYNVILVDWTNSNGMPYFQAIANARVVGAQLAQIIKLLQKYKGLKTQSVHLIGHSLGSHISGWAGERTPNIPRITALDPAGPNFYFGPEEVRLDTSDAEFVDVIHTNAGKIGIDGLGIMDAIGHIDFYPNGGEHQPGCKPTLVNVTVVGINVTAVGDGEGVTSLMATSCDHNEANEYFIASIANKNCTFIGKECEDADAFESGKCTSGIKAVMGLQAKPITNLPKGHKFFLKTSDTPPYCIFEN